MSGRPDDTRLDWPGLLRAGLQGLRLAPDQFWSLTPRELALMLGVGASAPPMGHARLLALLRDHPDDPAPAFQEPR